MLAIGVASTVFLAGCGNDTDYSKTPKVTPKVTPKSHSLNYSTITSFFPWQNAKILIMIKAQLT